MRTQSESAINKFLGEAKAAPGNSVALDLTFTVRIDTAVKGKLGHTLTDAQRKAMVDKASEIEERVVRACRNAGVDIEWASTAVLDSDGEELADWG